MHHQQGGDLSAERHPADCRQGAGGHGPGNGGAAWAGSCDLDRHRPDNGRIADPAPVVGTLHREVGPLRVGPGVDEGNGYESTIENKIK